MIFASSCICSKIFRNSDGSWLAQDSHSSKCFLLFWHALSLSFSCWVLLSLCKLKLHARQSSSIALTLPVLLCSTLVLFLDYNLNAINFFFVDFILLLYFWCFNLNWHSNCTLYYLFFQFLCILSQIKKSCFLMLFL